MHSPSEAPTEARAAVATDTPDAREQAAVATAPRPPRPPRRERRRLERHRRSPLDKGIRRALLVALAASLAMVGWSLGTALTAAGGDPASVKLVEWARDHGGNGLVNGIENWWYTHHPPPKGGRPKGGKLPAARPLRATTPTSRPQVLPRSISPIAQPALPGEGVWQPTGKLVHGTPAVYVTYFRPDPIHTSLVTTAMWMDAGLVRGALYNGLQLPGGGPWQHGAKIDPVDYPSLVAAFNGGFKLTSSRGGYYTEGRTVRPLVDGRASLVVTTDGTVSVGMWGRDFRMGPNIASVRQNLDLLVDDGKAAAGINANDTIQWGATLGNKVYVWRSGVCTDRGGDLIYFGGPGLNITSLANLEVAAGCVRAMELDINAAWVTGYTFTGGDGSGPLQADKLLAGMDRPANRYLTPGTRDFVALFAR